MRSIVVHHHASVIRLRNSAPDGVKTSKTPDADAAHALTDVLAVEHAQGGKQRRVPYAL